MQYDEFVGGTRKNPRPEMWCKHLFWRFGFRLSIHKLVDLGGVFHSHSAWCFRLVLWGGYTEEFLGGGQFRWRPGMFGVVPPGLIHRISELPRGVSYSLWLRLPKSAVPRIIEA